MAIQSFMLDPNAADDMTGDEIIAAINDGSASITRESALSQLDLKLVKSNPDVGEYPILNLQGIAGPRLNVDYDDVPA